MLNIREKTNGKKCNYRDTTNCPPDVNCIVENIVYRTMVGLATPLRKGILLLQREHLKNDFTTIKHPSMCGNIKIARILLSVGNQGKGKQKPHWM